MEGGFRPVPWIPKKIVFSGTKPIPSNQPKVAGKQVPKLLPIIVANNNVQQQPSNQNVREEPIDCDEDGMLQTQIKLSTKALEDVARLEKKVDQEMKEKEYYKAKLLEANRKLEKFQPNGKKVDGKKDGDEKNGTEPKENVKPNDQ